MSRTAHLNNGDILKGRYRIISHLNSGGMSAVYLAEETQTGKHWAIKESRLDVKWSRQLIIEAQLLSELEHPSLPKIADFFSSEKREYFYLVQEFINGQTLSELYEQYHHDLPVAKIVDIAIQLCDVLDFLHGRNIIYRDLKPGNVMIEANGKVKLIDFGIARKFDDNKLNDTVQIGTVGFAAPEQFEKTQTDHRTDLFSLGAMLYFLLSRGKYVYTTRKPLQRIRKGLPKKLTRCVELLTRLEPKHRCQSAIDAKKMLEDVTFTRLQIIASKRLKIEYTASIIFLIGVLIYIGVDALFF